MKRAVFAGAVAGILFTLACSDDGPAGPAGPGIEFSISAPASIESKGRIEIVVQILSARGVEYPLFVRFDKANAGESFNQEQTVPLFTRDQSRADLSSPAGRDPRYKVTVTESGPNEFSVSRTIGPIDVIDFQ